MKLAKEDNDYATENLLQWYINEQVEEEASAVAIMEKLKLVNNAASGLFIIDQELAGRK